MLALGNDILGDDGVGLAVARSLRAADLPGVDIVESSEAGLALLELFAGYDRAVLVDAVMTGRAAPGTVVEIDPVGLRQIVAPSPHYAGIPEIFELAARLDVPVPRHLRILAMEVANPNEICERFTPAVADALPALVARVRQAIEDLREDVSQDRHGR